MTNTKDDLVLSVIKAGISAVPYVGGPIASLISDYVPLSSERSIQVAVELLTKRLEKLEGRIDPSSVNRDEFSELFKSCYLVIVRTHQKSKLNAATALIANILLQEGDEEKLSYNELDHFVRALNALSIGAIEVIGYVYEMAVEDKNPNLGTKPYSFNFERLTSKMSNSPPSLVLGLVSELNSLGFLHMPGGVAVRTKDYGNYDIEMTLIGYMFVRYLLRA